MAAHTDTNRDGWVGGEEKKVTKTHATGRQRTDENTHGETEHQQPTRFLLRRAPKMLPACDRGTAHYCEAIRAGGWGAGGVGWGGRIMQRCKTRRHRLPEERRASACAFRALKTKGPSLSTFLSRWQKVGKCVNKAKGVLGEKKV